jgi:hypothetical protein
MIWTISGFASGVLSQEYVEPLEHRWNMFEPIGVLPRSEF